MLDATVQRDLQNYINKLEDLLKQIMEDLFVDDLITGCDKLTDVQTLKNTAIQIFRKSGFFLHKWHSNFHGLEKKQPRTKFNRKKPMRSNTWVSNLSRQNIRNEVG